MTESLLPLRKQCQQLKVQGQKWGRGPAPRRAGPKEGRLHSPAQTGGLAAQRRRGGEGWAGRLADNDAELLRGPQLHVEEHAVGPGLFHVPAGSSRMPEVGGEL